MFKNLKKLSIFLKKLIIILIIIKLEKLPTVMSTITTVILGNSG